jgi:NADPH:quinone reductase-like Zn-dependent oxidoreductase
MEKIVVHRPGSYDQLRLESHPTPAPGPGAVLVRTDACGVSYADVLVRRGLYASARQFVGWPITPGFEFAGRVEAVGEGVSAVAAGDRVAGVSRFGAYATHVVVPSQQLFAMPSGFSAAQAAGCPAVFMTAYHALYQQIVLRSGMSVLVHSAAGGVGTTLLQLGRIAGCRMIGVVGSTHKVETARAFGADEVIDTSVDDLWTRAEQYAPGGYDVVLDANGVSTLRQSYEHLRPTGRLVSYGFASMLPRGGGRTNYLKLAWDYVRTPRFTPLRMTTENRSVIAFNLSFLFDRPDILEEGTAAMLRWAGEGRLRSPAITTYTLADAGRAHRDLESGRTVGKLVLLTGSAEQALPSSVMGRTATS